MDKNEDKIIDSTLESTDESAMLAEEIGRPVVSQAVIKRLPRYFRYESLQARPKNRTLTADRA